MRLVQGLEKTGATPDPDEMPKTVNSGFQVLMVFVCLFCSNAPNIIVHGLPFMKAEPRHFSCLTGDTWSQCTREEICQRGLSTH